MPSSSTVLVWTRVIGQTFLFFSLSPLCRPRLPLAAPFLVDNETLAYDPIVRLKLLHDVSSVLSTEVHVARSHC